MTDGHPELDVLISLLEGELSDGAGKELFQHIVDCPRCFGACEDIWREGVQRAPAASVDLDAATASQVEQDLLRRLHRTRMAENVVELASQGFLFVILRLLQPIADMFSSRTVPIKRKE